MDFSRLSSGLNANISKQLAEQLLSNPLFRDAAFRAQRVETENTPEPEAPPSGLDDLLNQLSAALTRAADTPENAEAPATSPAVDTDGLLQHPFLDTLMGMLSTADQLNLKALFGDIEPEVAAMAVELLDYLPPDTMRKVESLVRNLSSEDLAKTVNAFQKMFGREDRVFFQQNNRDNYLSQSNQRQVTGADLDDFLRTAYFVANAGADLGDFMDASAAVLDKGDYDDFRRFLSVQDMVTYKREDLSTYFAFAKDLAENNPGELETNLFQLYTVLANGGRMQDYIAISSQLNDENFDQTRTNMVDFSRIITDFRNRGGYTAQLFRAMADETRLEDGDLRAFMDAYMDFAGLEYAGPDFEAYDTIYRIDGEVTTIKQGANAALFAQALSSADGLLPEEVLFWSSLEGGALGQGAHLDLSKLGVGTHTIVVKIGNNYAGGTDTAVKTIVVEPAESNPGDPEVPSTGSVTLPAGGQVRVTIENAAAAERSALLVRRAGLDRMVTSRPETNQTFDMNDLFNGNFEAGEALEFFMRNASENGNPLGDSIARVEQLSDTSWRIFFSAADAEEGDEALLVVLVELLTSGSAGQVPGGGVVVGGTSPAEETPEAETPVVVGPPPAPPVVEEEPPVVVAPPPPPPSPAEERAFALSTTKEAQAMLQSGASFSDIAALLNERYYNALDMQTDFNMTYAQRLQDAITQQNTRNTRNTLTTIVNQLNQGATGTGSYQ